MDEMSSPDGSLSWVGGTGENCQRGLGLREGLDTEELSSPDGRSHDGKLRNSLSRKLYVQPHIPKTPKFFQYPHMDALTPTPGFHQETPGAMALYHIPICINVNQSLKLIFYANQGKGMAADLLKTRTKAI